MQASQSRQIVVCAALSALLSVCAVPDTGPHPDAGQARPTELSQRLLGLAREAPLVVGHRGTRATHPENTLPSFAAAVAEGAQLVEFDVRESADHVLFCMHDATLDRTTDSEKRLGAEKVPLAKTRSQDLRELDAGSWKAARFAGVHPPTLEQALHEIRPAVPMIERKAGTPASYVELLSRMGLQDEVVVQSFDWAFLEELHRLEPRITIGALGGKPVTAETWEKLRRTGASLVHWAADALTAEAVAGLHRRGYLVCVYTINTDLEYLGAAAMGLDAITTDVPARLAQRIRDGEVAR